MGTDIHGVFQKRTPTGWQDVPSEYDQGRDYQLFAVLADVRNGFGFAGVKTGEVVTPVAPRRGLPSDFAMDGDTHPIRDGSIFPSYLRYHDVNEGLWMGDHSFSWLTGAEILRWAETAPVVVKTGVLSREQYANWDGKSTPESYSGDVWGKDVVIVDDNKPAMEAHPDYGYVRCSWDSPLRERLAYFFDEVARLVGEYGEVRFVFGFDS